MWILRGKYVDLVSAMIWIRPIQVSFCFVYRSMLECFKLFHLFFSSHISVRWQFLPPAGSNCEQVVAKASYVVCGVSTCRPRQNLLGVIHCFVNSLFLRPRLQLQRVHKHGVFVKELRTRALNACISGFRGDISHIPCVRVIFTLYRGEETSLSLLLFLWYCFTLDW